MESAMTETNRHFSPRATLAAIGLKHLVHKAFLALEVVIKLALPGSRCFDDLVRAGSANHLFMK
jgi:hypothetical protein